MPKPAKLGRIGSVENVANVRNAWHADVGMHHFF